MRVTEERVLELLARCPEPWAVAETLCAEEVAAGEYAGCSTALEIAFTEYEHYATCLLEEAGGR